MSSVEKKYEVIYRGISPDGDQRKMTLAAAKLLGITQNEALEKIKDTPIVLRKNVPEAQADKVFKLLRSYGAVVSLREEGKEALEVTHEESPISTSRIHSTFLMILSFVLITTIMVVGGRYVFSKGKDRNTSQEKSTNKVKARNVFEKLMNQTATAGDYMEEAIKLIQAKNEAMRKSKWKSYMKESNGEMTPFFSKNEYKQTMALLKEAEKRNPDEANVNRWMAYLQNRQGKDEKAEASYKKALKKNPKDVGLINEYAAFLMDSEMYGKADYYFRSSLQISPKNTEALKNLGVINQFYLEQPKKAKSYYSQYMKVAQRSDPERYLIARELSLLAWKQYNSEKYPKKGEVKVSFTEFEKERKLLEKQIKENPKNYKSLERQGVLFARRGFHEDGARQIRKAMKVNETSAVARNELAKIYMSLEKPEVSHRVLKEGARLGIKDVELIRNLALLEKYYKYDIPEMEKLMKKYLEYGGTSRKFLQDLKSDL